MENKTHGLMIMAGFLLGAITVGVLVKRPPKENIYFRCHECCSLVLPEEDLCPVCGSQVKRINNTSQAPYRKPSHDVGPESLQTWHRLPE